MEKQEKEKEKSEGAGQYECLHPSLFPAWCRVPILAGKGEESTLDQKHSWIGTTPYSYRKAQGALAQSTGTPTEYLGETDSIRPGLPGHLNLNSSLLPLTRR